MSVTYLIFLLNVAGIYASTYHLNGVETGFSYLTRVIKENLTLTLTSVQENWITQPLNHFDKNDNRVWKMRYFQNFDYFDSRGNGPIYIYIGGEAEQQPGAIAHGIIVDLAQKTRGALFASEHRYYGKSLPLTPINNVNNLKYLSANQALADLARMIQALKSMPQFANSKVVVVGGSYPGNLAAWMRQQYPALVDIAISSSAPLLAKVDFPEYLEKVGQVFKTYGSVNCLDKASRSFYDADQLLNTAQGKQRLGICQEVDMTNPINKGAFFISYYFPYADAVQYGDSFTIAQMCRNQHRSVEKVGCNNPFQSLVAAHKSSHMVPWFYQTCTEFGYFMTNANGQLPFWGVVPVEMYADLCSMLFGQQFTLRNIQRNVYNTNRQFGGLRPNVNKVIFTNGDMDPWSTLGVTQTISDSAPAIVIRGVSHCRDLMAPQSTDSEELRRARLYIIEKVLLWLRT